MKRLIVLLLLSCGLVQAAENDIVIEQVTATGARVRRNLVATQPVTTVALLADELGLGATDTATHGALIANSLTSKTGSALTLVTLDSNANVLLTPHGSGQVRAVSTGGLVLPSTNTAGIKLFNTADETTNFESGALAWSSNVFGIRVTKGGSGTGRNFTVETGSGAMVFGGAASNTVPFFDVTPNATSSGRSVGSTRLIAGTVSTATSGTFVAVSLSPGYNQASGTSANTDLLIQRTETAIGSGAQYLLQAGTAALPTLLTVTNTGIMALTGNVASSSSTTGTLVIGSTGGIGLGGALNAAGTISGLSYTSGAPNGGTAAAWKFGIAQASTLVALDTANWVELDVGGTLKRLALITITTP